jgi:hypothetical protein
MWMALVSIAKSIMSLMLSVLGQLETLNGNHQIVDLN